MKRASDGMTKIAMTIAQVISLGAFVGLFALPIGVGIAVLARLPWWSPFAIAATACLLVVGVVGVLFTLRDRRLLWAVERATALDLDQDRSIGKPEEKKDRPFIHVYRDDKIKDRFNEQRDFRFWLEKVYSGDVKTTWSDWKNVRMPSGETMTQSRWETYCNRLLDAGLAERSHATAPIELKGKLADALLSFREVL